MSFDPEDWLGVEVTVGSKVLSLPDRIKDLLKAGFKDEVWDVDDTPYLTAHQALGHPWPAYKI